MTAQLHTDSLTSQVRQHQNELLHEAVEHRRRVSARLRRRRTDA